MLKVGLTTDLIGLALIAAALVVQLGRGRKKPATELKTSPAADTK
jgi:hypothetical protein